VLRLESLGVKNKNSRETIRNQMVQKTLSASGMILKKFLALSTNTNWAATEHPVPTSGYNQESTENYRLFLKFAGPPERRLKQGETTEKAT